MVFYKDDAQFFGRKPKISSIPADILLDMQKGFKKKLPINHTMHFHWKISKQDKQDKWWETSELKSTWARERMNLNGYYPTPAWDWKNGLRWKYFTHPIPQILVGMDTRFVEEKIHITFRYQCGIKIAAAGQTKTFYGDTYITWYSDYMENDYDEEDNGPEPSLKRTRTLYVANPNPIP